MALAERSARALGGEVGPELERLAWRVRPVATADQRVLPVLDPLESLVPGGLLRGLVVSVGGLAASSLALALSAGPSRSGSWVASVGIPTLGLVAAAEIGVDLSRLAVVRQPPPSQWAPVVAALIGAFDLVLLRPPRQVGHSDARRLAARARERGTTLLVVGGRGGLWPGTDLDMTVAEVHWQGLGCGHGHLRSRWVRVTAEGRGRAARPREAELWLLDPDGRVTPVLGRPVVVPFESPQDSGSSRRAELPLRAES